MFAVRFDEFVDFEKETRPGLALRHPKMETERTINFRDFEVAFERRENVMGHFIAAARDAHYCIREERAKK